MKKRTLALVLAALMILTAFVAVPASAGTSGDWEYTVNDDGTTATINRYYGSATNVTIPSEIDGYSVTELSAWKHYTDDDYEFLGIFYNTSVKTVTIPDSVTTIGDRAFEDCTSLTSVTIPDSVTSIGDYAFYYCTSLTSIDVDLDNAYYKSIDGILYTKDGATLKVCPAGIELTSVIIPDSVTTIGDRAFYKCASLASIKIPDSVTEIGNVAFVDTAYYKNSSNWDGFVLYIDHHLVEVKRDITGEYTIKSGTMTIPHRAFADCALLTSVTIPDSVTKIGDSAFSNCTSLTSVTIGNSVTEIGMWAFSTCTSLKSVDIPDSVKTVGRNAFAKCTSLTSVTIGNSVTAIDIWTFADCTSLTSVTIGDGVKEICGRAFENCTSLTNVIFGVGITSIEYAAFGGCTSLKSVTIPDGVTTISWNAFENCTSLTSVTIPASVEAINFGPFVGCTSLETLYFNGTEDRFAEIWIYDYYNPDLKVNIIFAKENTDPVTPGDLNGDGKINSRDVIAIMKLVLTPNAEVTAVNDLTGDGKLNSRDVIALMKLVLAQV